MLQRAASCPGGLAVSHPSQVGIGRGALPLRTQSAGLPASASRAYQLYSSALQHARLQARVCKLREQAPMQWLASCARPLQDVVAARSAFQECTLADPSLAKAWVSWAQVRAVAGPVAAGPGLVPPWCAAAQMEKRSADEDGRDPIQRCRLVLQRALVANPHNAKICQVLHSRCLVHAGPAPGHSCTAVPAQPW